MISADLTDCNVYRQMSTSNNADVTSWILRELLAGRKVRHESGARAYVRTRNYSIVLGYGAVDARGFKFEAISASEVAEWLAVRVKGSL